MNIASVTQVNTPQSYCQFSLKWADITPPPNIYHRMWGAAKHDRATGVHRPLRATAAIFEPADAGHSGPESRQILLALDHCVMGAKELDQLVAQVAELSGQPAESILVVFSHTHAAGLMSLDRAALPGGELIPDYIRSVGECAAGLITQCIASLAPVAIVYGNGRCALAAHRDFWDDEQEQFVCGYDPGAPADDTVLVARATNREGNLVATLVNYACHPTTLAWDNTLISPDYIGAMRETVERETGAPCLFLQGASGELGPREGFVGDTAVADRNGRELAYAALSALAALPPARTRFCYTGPVVSGATLGAWAHKPLAPDQLAAKSSWRLSRWREFLPYRRDQPAAEQVSAALERFQADEKSAVAAGDAARAAECRAMAERKRRLLHRLEQMPLGESFPLQVVMWRIGDAFWIGVQGESYSLLQTELRRRFPGTPLLVCSIAADWGASYLPPREIYGKGIYQESIAIVGPGGLEQLIEAVAKRIAVNTSE